MTDESSQLAGSVRNNRQPASRFRLGRLLDRRLRQLVFRRLESLRRGRLTIVDAEGRESFGESAAGSVDLELVVHDTRFYRRLVFGGSLGAAEAYFLGYWDANDLVELVRMVYRETAIASRMESGMTRLAEFHKKIAHRLRKNSLTGSRRNIAAHYDLGEDFFALILDETMAYSCGVFPHPQSTLREASLAKFAHVCRKLQLREEDELVEIGAGWGGFALYAAQQYGCRVTTTTISKRQYEFTAQRVEAEGLADRITVLRQDYRKLRGRFDKLVSIEMIEAVGYEYFDTYFAKCSRLLKPSGMMLLQAITIPDYDFDRYRRSVDFIRRYVFPGGCLPSVGAICASLGRVTDLRPVHFEDFADHYAETLTHWRRRFDANREKIESLGFNEQFMRLWEFYLCSCEAGFRERIIGDVQIVLCKPAVRAPDNHAR